MKAKKQISRTRASNISAAEAIQGRHLSKDAAETRAWGAAFAAYLSPGDAVYLTGEVGCGKTTFVQGALKAFGIGRHGRSASFMLVNEYRAPRFPVYHMDLYRLAGNDIEGLGIEEYLYGSGVCFVEWSDKITKQPSSHAWAVELEWVSEHERTITIRRLAGTAEGT